MRLKKSINGFWLSSLKTGTQRNFKIQDNCLIMLVLDSADQRTHFHVKQDSLKLLSCSIFQMSVVKLVQVYICSSANLHTPANRSGIQRQKKKQATGRILHHQVTFDISRIKLVCRLIPHFIICFWITASKPLTRVK